MIFMRVPLFKLHSAGIFLAIGITALLPDMAGAGSLPRPTGPVVLTVSGQITRTNAGDTAEFDLAMLEALPGRTARVSTPWAEGVNTFQGPLTRAVLDAVGARGSRLKMIDNWAEPSPMQPEYVAKPHRSEHFRKVMFNFTMWTRAFSQSIWVKYD